jgi:hypothetical protein
MYTPLRVHEGAILFRLLRVLFSATSGPFFGYFGSFGYIGPFFG